MREILASLWLGLTITALIAPDLAGKWLASVHAGYWAAVLP